MLFAVATAVGIATPASAFDPFAEAKKAACKKTCDEAEAKCTKECDGPNKAECKQGCKESTKSCLKKCMK